MTNQFSCGWWHHQGNASSVAEVPSVDSAEDATMYGVKLEELADPPIKIGTPSDLNGGKALLLSVSMQKVMPRPSG